VSDLQSDAHPPSEQLSHDIEFGSLFLTVTQ